MIGRLGDFVQPLGLAPRHERPVVESHLAARLEQPAAERHVIGPRIHAEGITPPLPVLRAGDLDEIMVRQQTAGLIGLVHGGERIARLALMGLHALGQHIDGHGQCPCLPCDQHVLGCGPRPDDPQAPPRIPALREPAVREGPARGLLAAAVADQRRRPLRSGSNGNGDKAAGNRGQERG